MTQGFVIDKDTDFNDEQVKELLAHPKIASHVAAAQASRDKEIARLKRERESKPSGEPEDTLLDVLKELRGSKSDGDDGDDILTRMVDKVQRRTAERNTEKALADAQRMKTARGYAEKFKEYGVHMEDLLDMDDSEMQDYSLGKVKEALTQKKEGDTPPPATPGSKAGPDGKLPPDLWEKAVGELGL